jgi:RNA polymerase sigma-70 factor (ECF subfamily)
MGQATLYAPRVSTSSSNDAVIVERLKAGEELAFAELLTSWSRSMLRLARSYVSSQASAEDVVQDTWMAVIKGIDGFEGRSSLRTWVYRILVNTAKKKGVREGRTVPSESLSATSDDHAPTVDPARFRGPEDQYPGGWREFPAAWSSTEGAVLAGEVRGEIAQALDTLPERQRNVITLRDVLGHSSDEVCELLEISTANQRVLLHRARAAVRHRLAGYYLGQAEELEGA